MAHIELFGRVVPVNEKDYNEKDYWAVRPFPTSSDDLYEQSNLEFVRSQINRGDKVLDFGPGVGRLFRVYKEKEAGLICACDISTLYKERLYSEAGKLGIDISYFECMEDVCTTSFPDDFFDVVVASQVLLHQRPGNILLVMKELARVAKKVVVISSYEDNWFFDTPNGETYDERRGCFNYNYPVIVSDNNWEMLHNEIYMEQIFFVYRRVKHNEK